MEDRNRRDQRPRQDRNREQYSADAYGARQAEQFDDSEFYQQAGETGYSQDSRRDWRDASPRPSRQRDNFGWASGYAARDAGFGDDYYDNGLGAYGSEDANRRYASRSRSESGRSRDRERGFFDRAGDEVASWFGDEDAARRRQQDHRGKGPANYKRTDERILENVCDCLTEDRQLDARNIQVTVSNGEVTLDGTVDDRGAKRRAEDIVEDISGVGHVQNNLRVHDTAAGSAPASET